MDPNRTARMLMAFSFAGMLLAPLVRNRKGEHLHLLDQLRQDGFVRVRVDGIVTDLDDTPKLKKNQKHDIDVVVDRFKVRDDISLRLSESFETAVQLSDGLATISFMESEQDDVTFSALFACPQCGHSISELEPRLFSFNNPAGACATCDGLGLKQYFDEKKIDFWEVVSIEGNILSKIMNLIYLLDYASIYRAILSNTNPSTIKSIDYIKEKLEL